MDIRLSKLGSWIICFVLVVGCGGQRSNPPYGFVTKWSVKPSLKYDTCNLIGILTGRELYKKYYPDIYRDWRWKMPAAVNSAIFNIDRLVGPNWPPGPRLSMLMSAVPADGSLTEILHAMDNSASVYERLMQSDYGSQKNWRQWLELKPHLQVVWKYLIETGFEEYWRTNLLPTITAKIPQTENELKGYDVVGDLERFLVDYEYDDTIRVHLLSLAQPHEVRLSSQARYTDIRHPLRSTVVSFYHEMLHEYCDRLVDSVFVQQFASLEQDAVLQESLARFSANGGNGGFKDLLKKNLVIAAELRVTQRRHLLAPQPDPGAGDDGEFVRQFFRQKNNGAHVLAAVIYSYLDAGLKLDRISYADFIKDLFASGRLRPGRLAARHRWFLDHGDTTVPQVD